MSVRINAEGLLEILHSETGAYVPASTLLQVEGGLLAALIPEQVALLADIRDASAYLSAIEEVLSEVRDEVTALSSEVAQSNELLELLTQINNSLGVVTNTISALEGLDSDANALLSVLQAEIVQLSNKIPASLGAKSRNNSLSIALATDSTIFGSLDSLLAALSDGGSNSVYSALQSLSAKIPTTLGAKLREASMSVALATDSTIFTSLANILSALSDNGVNSVYTALIALSAKIPTSLGAKIRDSSLSVALATDSTIFTSLTNILNALTGTGSNTVYSTLLALSAKIPASLGAKIRTESMSVALATDSTIFTSLTSILNALSDGGTNSALSYLGTVAGAQFWKTPVKFNTNSPIINAASAATSSAAYAINAQAEGLILQNFFSASGVSAQFAVELRITAGATSISDKTYYYRGDIASPFLASAGAYPGESPIVVPTQGHAQAVVHLSAISGSGNVTTYVKEIK